ncbi:MAG: putative Ig domain-containing protein [Steroidobacteraceae bacterium]
MQLVATFERLALFRSPSTLLIRCSRAAAFLLLLCAQFSPAAAGTLYIGGTPAATVTAPINYYFRPWVAGSNAAKAKFAVHNMPWWATFNPTTGVLQGKVYPAQVGHYSNISISATDGQNTAYMPSFSISVVAAGTQPPPSQPPPATDTPKISGTPTTSVAVSTAYSFTPTASDPKGTKLTFSVNTKPSWVSFNSTTGQLSGTPAAANVGTTSNIIITASNGTAKASLAAFSLTVTQIGAGSTTLSWQPPTQNTNGTALTNLAGYKIQYGTNKSSLSQTVQVANPGLTRYVVSNLSPGTWYFGTQAYTTVGTQSALSALASKTIK